MLREFSLYRRGNLTLYYRRTTLRLQTLGLSSQLFYLKSDPTSDRNTLTAIIGGAPMV